MSDTENLPAPVHAGDGFDNIDRDDDRIIQGTIIKCNDGHWQDRDGLPIPSSKLLAVNTTGVVQCWQNQTPTDTIRQKPGEPDVDELNAKIPEDEWEPGIDGKPRPPWQRQEIVYFLDPATAAKYTFASGTVGARIAIGGLKSQVQCMRMLRGDRVVPVVELASKPMKTKFGSKLRPEFKIVSWCDLGADGITAKAPLQIADLKTVKPVTTEEAIGDSLAF